MAVQDFIVHEVGDQLFRKLTQPASGGEVGDPGLVGDRPCVLLTDQDAAGYATCKFNGSFRLLVEGADGSGDSAIAIGGAVYSNAAATIKVNEDATNGVRFGTAVEAVASGAETVIVVDLHG
jgi:hypothetical protein